MLSVLEAIAEQEGFNVPGSRPNRNNNPGDLTYCPESVKFGATGTDGRFAIFPDVATGWAALRRWLSVPAKFDTQGNLVGGYLNATIEQAINRFAPPSENNSTAYVDFVCKETGMQPTTILTADNLG